MSGWTEYVIADKKDAQAIADSYFPQEKWRGFEGYKFFGPSHLAPLCQVLGQKSATFADFPELAIGAGGWVYELPQSMTDALKKAHKDSLPEIAAAWSNGLALINERYSGDELLTLLGQIRALLIKAKKARKPVLLWQSATG
jgi:hypothetical protein